MGFIVNIRKDLSLKDLTRLAEAGNSVVRTSHVGNQCISNLIVNSLEVIQIVLADQTIGQRDRNYHPHLVMRGGRLSRICDESAMLTHARVSRIQEVCSEWFKEGDRVADCHLAALRRVFPKTSFVLFSDFVREHEAIYREIFEASSILAGPLYAKGFFWKRLVSGGGKVRESPSFSSWENIRGKVYPLDQDEGWVIPNFLHVLAAGVIQALDSGKSEVYHVSGPDMVYYIASMTALLEEAYTILQTREGRALPREIVFNLVPVAGVRFGVLESQRQELDELVAALSLFLDDSENRAQRIKTALPYERFHVVGECHRHRGKLWQGLKAAALRCRSVLYDIHSPPFTCQYDLLGGGEGLYVHPWALESPVGEVERGYRTIAQIMG